MSPNLKQDLARFAFERGADSVGVADVAAYAAVTSRAARCRTTCARG